MREGLQKLNAPSRQYPQGQTTECQDRPVPFTEVEQSPADAAELCGRGTDDECPLLEICAQFGFTEGIYADRVVYGGYTWRRGLPLVSETGYQESKKKGNYR
jgi:hypothetical protein